MIELSYELTDTRSEDSRVDFAKVEDSALHFEHFPGRVYIRAGETDLSPKWDWTPIFDFFVCLRKGLHEFHGPKKEFRFEFTESEAALNFRREGENIVISASYSPDRIVLPLREYENVLSQTSTRLHTELLQRYPTLRANKFFEVGLLGRSA
jgi:hypothetical protein